MPLNIDSLLTPLGLCYWLCDDGSFNKTSQLVVICTDSFSLEEVKLLANTLNKKFNLECYVNKTAKNRKGFRILIPRRSLTNLQALLKQHMPPMMLRKIGL